MYAFITCLVIFSDYGLRLSEVIVLWITINIVLGIPVWLTSPPKEKKENIL